MTGIIFTIICILVIVGESVLTGFLLKKRPAKIPVNLFVELMVTSSVTMLTYCIRIHCSNYFIMSFLSSIYFASIDIMLLIMLDLIITITDFKMHLFQVVTRRMAFIYGIFDCIVMMINPFREIALRYVRDTDNAGHWFYDPGVMYILHLILCYIIVVMIAYCLILKIAQTPQIYRSRYTLILGGIFTIVILNAAFYYLSTVIGFHYDISVLLYGALCLLLYFNSAHYSGWKLMRTAPRQVLLDLGLPVFIFDYEKKMVIANNSSDKILHGEDGISTMEEFTAFLKIEDRIKEESTSFQLVIDRQFYRCDFQVLKKKGSLQGYVFTFTEVSTEYDMLTGFRFYASAIREFAKKGPELPAGVLVFDINRLSRINEIYGHEEGDHAIASVSEVIKTVCPENAILIRLHDAAMAAVCPASTLREMKDISAEIEEAVKNLTVKEEKLVVAGAFAMCTNAQPELTAAIESAKEAVRIKKMLDPDSAHSSLLFSLARILQESDPCTEAHVKRTRILGEHLAARLGLTDEDTAALSLLCLLHDVGKLCIPLEILNNPGKLTNAEWELMKTHTNKGWNIAKASRELSPIADLILYHHERWDGKGYPVGLSKEEIPLLSRMISIIDSYDAMTNDRPYRKKITRHEAIAEIERCSGTQFDPYLAGTFCDMIRKQADYLGENAEKADTEIPIVPEEKKIVPENKTDMRSAEDTGRITPVRFCRYTLESDREKIISADRNFEYMTGYDQEDIDEGIVTQGSLIFSEDKEEYFRLTGQMLKQNKEVFFEHRIRMKNGISRSVYSHGWSYFDAAHKEQKYQIIITDLTESAAVNRMLNEERRVALNSQNVLKESLRLDSLTGLMNRMAFRSDLQEILTTDNRACAMVMCDIDYFKHYNDSYGHIYGDELLKGLGRILKEYVKDGDLACRMGGDEFAAALIFPKNTAPDNIRQECRMFCDAVEQELKQFGSTISVSMGMTCSYGKEKNFEQMYDEADKALYQAKEAGRSCISFFGTETA